MLVRDGDLITEEKSISINTKVKFDIKTYRSLSWVMKLERIFSIIFKVLLVLKKPQDFISVDRGYRIVVKSRY